MEMAETELEEMGAFADNEADPNEFGLIGGEVAQEAQAFATPRPDVLNVGNKSFILQGEKYVDTAFDPDTMEPTQVVFFSDEYFELIDTVPELATYFTIGDAVIVVIDGEAYEVIPEEV
jgi:hypothetical protein